MNSASEGFQNPCVNITGRKLFPLLCFESHLQRDFVGGFLHLFGGFFINKFLSYNL